jgi:hypothetical protein
LAFPSFLVFLCSRLVMRRRPKGLSLGCHVLFSAHVVIRVASGFLGSSNLRPQARRARLSSLEEPAGAAVLGVPGRREACPCVAGHTQSLRLVSVSRPPARLLRTLSDLAASVFFRQHSSESTSRFPLRFRTPLVFRVRLFTNAAGSSLVRLEVSRFFCTAPVSALVLRSARCPVASRSDRTS